MSLEETLGNNKWMAENKEKILAILPETWTHLSNLHITTHLGMQLAFNLKLLGIDWRSPEEYANCMVFFTKSGLLSRDDLLVRRSS